MPKVESETVNIVNKVIFDQFESRVLRESGVVYAPIETTEGEKIAAFAKSASWMTDITENIDDEKHCVGDVVFKLSDTESKTQSFTKVGEYKDAIVKIKTVR
jgi:hypothetical protein